MKITFIASGAFILVLAFSVSLCLGGAAFGQTPGLATRIAHGSTLPSGAEQFSEFELTSGTPTLYICNANPCTNSGQWVTSTGSAGYVNVALSNLSGVAINTALYSATGVNMTISGFPGTSGNSPTSSYVLGGNAYTSTSQTPGSIYVQPGSTSAVGATPGNINLIGQAGYGTTGSGSNIYVQAGAGGSTSPRAAGLISFGGGGASAVSSESSPLTGSYVPSLYVNVGASTFGGEVDFVNVGSSNGVIRVTGMPFAFYADNTYDFDLAAYRPKNVYIGTGLYLGSTTVGFTGITSAISGNLMAAGTVAGSSIPLCTDAFGNLTITTVSCPSFPTTGTLTNGNYVSASGTAAEQDSGVLAGPYTTLPWETAPNCSGGSLGTITSANKSYVFGITLEFPLSTSKIFYDVTNSDNTGNEYDLAVYQGAPSGTENRLLHTGSSASTGQPGTTFAPANGWQHLNWYEGTTVLQPGRYYVMFTSSCTSGGAYCAEIASNASSEMFYWPGSGGVSISSGGNSPTTYSSSADSPGSNTVPCLLVE
jgi:hypothetical protein